jgi:uncharacterized protein YlbG (UPF0298 family)
MSSEIVYCSKCRSEYELMYKDDEVVNQTYCKCPRLSDKERLNKAIKELEQKFNTKLKGVSNAKNQSSTR